MESVGTVDSLAVLEVVLLLVVANGAPIVARKLFGEVFSNPLDLGTRFSDGRPLLGPSKTARGVLFSVVCTTLAAPVLGRAPGLGALVAVLAMAGDLVSSFTKRRLGMQPSECSLGLDQVPEALLPVLILRESLELTLLEVGAVVAVFFVVELALSRVLFAIGIRDRPY